MQFKFKRHQKVKILVSPDPEYTEFHDEPLEIKKGMPGKINIILPNGKYHVEILDDKDNVIAYAPFDEDQLESAE